MTARRGPRQGRIESFDDPRGLGTVVDEDGAPYDFHCTAVADGSRTIAVGTTVTFVLVAGHLGRLEGRHIRPLGSTLGP